MKKKLVELNDICVHADTVGRADVMTDVNRPRRPVGVLVNMSRTIDRCFITHDGPLRDAIIKAGTLAEGLGDSWQGRVWENLGWHFSATLGKCVVYDNGGPTAKRYWASLDDTRNLGAFPQVCATGRTSREAVLKVIREAELIAARLSDAALELRG